jgi:nucleotide-binding universal stress UspA family protein
MIMAALNVLIPLDGSSFSQRILRSTLDFLKPQHHHLILMRVTPPPTGVVGIPPRMLPFDGGAFIPSYNSASDLEQNQHPIYETQTWESIKAKFSHELSEAATDLQGAGFEISLLVHFGDAAEEIIRATRQREVDFIVMATHGRKGLERMLLGSVAEEVLRHVSVPVLMLRPEGKEKMPRSGSTRSNILIPLDESEFSRTVVEPVIRLLQPSEYHLTLLRVATPPRGEDPRSMRASVPGAWQDTDGGTLEEETQLRLEQERTSYYTRLFEDRKDELLREMESAKDPLSKADFTVECAVRFGQASEAISEFATFNDVALIVMATHSRTGLERFVLGSVTKEVFNHVHVPMLIIRPQANASQETLPAASRVRSVKA